MNKEGNKLDPSLIKILILNSICLIINGGISFYYGKINPVNLCLLLPLFLYNLLMIVLDIVIIVYRKKGKKSNRIRVTDYSSIYESGKIVIFLTGLCILFGIIVTCLY